ncbi:MAG: YwiC-like family protein [Actinomycetaceae bacterium]|nr:YwiC-like family protein [Actinomycetaceae bacterium]
MQAQTMTQTQARTKAQPKTETQPVAKAQANAQPKPQPAVKARPKRKRRSPAIMNGWIPDQHGAWAMGFMPLLAGIILADKTWTLTLLALAWVGGFLLFGVFEKYLKSRFRVRYRPAVITYGAVTAAFGLPLLVLAPHLLWWALIYVPLVGYWAYNAWSRHERALSSRISTIISSVLIAPLATNVPNPEPWFSGATKPLAWLFAALLGVYFALTVPYVKTLIRERGQQSWLIGSITAHAIAVIAACVLAFNGWVSWLHAIVWFGLLVRAIAMPLGAQRRGKPWRPGVIGPLEIAISFAVLLTLPWSLTL